MVWQWGEGKTYSGVPARILLGMIFNWDDIPSKRRKDELESLGACYEGQQERMPGVQANKTVFFIWSQGVAQPVQVSGGGWTADKLVSGQEEHPKLDKNS